MEVARFHLERFLAAGGAHPVAPLETSSKVFDHRRRIAVGRERVLRTEMLHLVRCDVGRELPTPNRQSGADVGDAIGVFQDDCDCSVMPSFIVLLAMVFDGFEDHFDRIGRKVLSEGEALRQESSESFIVASIDQSIERVSDGSEEDELVEEVSHARKVRHGDVDAVERHVDIVLHAVPALARRRVLLV